MTGTSRAFAAALAVAFIALHLPYTPRSLEDVDSINFALAIRDFDVAEHQPHPPGYPVFVLIAKLAAALAGSEARALALLAVLCGGLSAFVLVALLDALGRRAPGGRLVAIAAAAIVLTAPLMWITAARPLSDVPGLAAALLVQWLVVRAPSARALAAAAFAAGLAAGVRSQIVWLTVPLLALVVAGRRDVRRFDALGRIAGSYAAGVVVWAVPLLVLSGGPRAYWNAVAFQGGADLSGVTMLWTTPTPRQFAAALQYVFVEPWGWPPLAAAVLAAAAIGAARLLAKAPSVLGLLAAAFGPYLAFTMLFQETVTTRYALPLVVPVAFLAAAGIVQAAPRYAPWLAAGIAAVALSIAQPSLAAYASDEAPAFRMLADMRAATNADGGPAPVLAVHRRQEFDLRRPLDWLSPEAPAFSRRLAAPPRYEWLELVRYWNSGGRATVWFVGDPLRSDLALVHHAGPRAEYRWPIRFRGLIGGVRPSEMDWYRLEPPAWYLGEGWALTPEAAGVAAASGRGPAQGGSEGWIRRTGSAATLMIGGRLLPGPRSEARLTVFIDGRVVDETPVAPGFFLRMVELPPGALAGDGAYAVLRVEADTPQVTLEQFDAQPDGMPVYGFAEGWHEHEYNPATGDQWRWSSDRSAVRVRADGRALALRLRGVSESGGTAALVLRAGGQIVASEQVGPAFVVAATIPAAALPGEESLITIETDGSFVPAESQWRSQDRRRLGLKIVELRLTPAS